MDTDKYIEKLISCADDRIKSAIVNTTIAPDTVFIREQQTVENIYILISGSVKATDYRVSGMVYDYMKFRPVEVFGAMEVFMDFDRYRTTLITITECRFKILNRVDFINWMNTDVNALMMINKSTIGFLFEQGRRERVFLFLQGIDRVYMLFMRFYEESEDDTVHINYTRKQIADMSGLCEKTVNRAVNRMEKEDCITRYGNKIVIDSIRYDRIKKYMAGKIADDSI